MSPDYTPLFHWVREREAIRIRKDSGMQFPWTEDKILAMYRFCNVRREDDRGTVWIRDHIRDPYADHPMLWLMLCIGRQINWPDTLAEMIAKKAWPSDDSFLPSLISRVLRDRKLRGEKVYTGAYMISAPVHRGTGKDEYIAESVIGDLWRRRSFLSDFRDATLQRTHQRLMQSSGWGQFMAYQAVVDMRFTALLRNAPDIHSWAAAGPGTIRGLNRLYDRPLGFPLPQDRALSEMRDIYKIVQQETGVAMDFSDVPNILCETDKYLRVLNNEGKPRALYVPGRGS